MDSPSIFGNIATNGTNNLTIMPWFEYGLMTPPDSALAKLHPDWLTIGQKGVESISENLIELYIT